MEVPRLFEYFAVYGLNEDLPITTFTLPSDREKAELYTGIENAISSLRLRVINEDEVLMSNKTEFLNFYELACRDGKRLWLEIVYGRVNGHTRASWTGRSISRIELYYMQYEGEYIKIPVTHCLEPVPVLIGSKAAQHRYSHTENDHHYYSGNYDITLLLNAKQMDGLRLVMTCTYTDTTPGMPIVDIKMVAASIQQNAKGELKKVAVIPDNYQYINFPLGKSKDTFLCFKNLKDPLSTVLKAELIEKFPREDHPDNPLSQAINMFCFSEGILLTKEQEAPKVFSFILSSANESTGRVKKMYVTCLIFYEQINEKISNILHILQDATNKVYMPKAICLISNWPFIDQYREILKQIYRLHLSTYEVPIERVICNLIQEVPLPDQGVTTVQYSIGNKRLYFSRPPPKYLPYLPDTCLEYLFRCLPINDVVSVWSCVLVERKVLLISQHKALLTYTSIALTQLIFPFRWEQVLIPILPMPLKNYIETIFPYIIGVSPSMITKELEIPVDAVKVDLDTGRIESREPLPRLPDKLQRGLISRLMKCANIYSQKDPIRETADEAFDSVIRDLEECNFNPYQIKDAFIEFFAHLLKNYQRYFLMPNKSGDKVADSRQCFNTAEFLNYHKSNKPENFLFKVTETSLFASFIESRYFPTDNQYELNYFDDSSRFKRTKNDPFFVKPYYPQETLPALYANDIGFEPGMVFQYDSFPRLNESNFIEPRRVQQLAVNAAPKPTLLLKDDMLMRMTQIEWGKFLMTTIYRVWFMAFTACMPRYKQFSDQLMDLALSIMDTMKKNANKPDEEIYRKLIEACGHCGLRERVLSLFKRMKNQGIEPDACTHGVYVTAVAEGQELQKEVENVLSLSDLPPGSICLSLDMNNCMYVAEDNCPNCSNTLEQEDIMMGWERSYSNYTTKCPEPNCEAKFVARFLVILDKNIEASNTVSVEFLSPPIIRKELENLIYTHGERALLAKDLCDRHKILFWNMALNFDLLKLPSFFLNPGLDMESLPEIIAESLKQPKYPAKDKSPSKRQEKPNRDFASNSVDESISDTSSISGASSTSNASYTGFVDNKIFGFMNRRNKSRTSSIASDNQSTKSSIKNMSLKKLFQPYIENFRNENHEKVMKSPYKDRMENEGFDEHINQEPPEMPQMRSMSRS